MVISNVLLNLLVISNVLLNLIPKYFAIKPSSHSQREPIMKQENKSLTVTLFRQHHLTRQKQTEKILDDCNYNGLVISSGGPEYYFQDDQEIPFKPNPQFLHWIPLFNQNTFLHIRPGQKTKLILLRPRDHWHEKQSEQEITGLNNFEVIQVEEEKHLWPLFGNTRHHAFVGSDTKRARNHKIEVNPPHLLHRLNWDRALKTDYEVSCLRKANEIASKGHVAARSCFKSGGSELTIHQKYLETVQTCETELPYTTIVGLDNKSAILHYQNKRQSKNHSVLLIDAGYRYLGYCSDITRTYIRNQTNQTFVYLLEQMEKLQQQLCSSLKAGIGFYQLQTQFLEKLAVLLLESNIANSCSTEFLLDNEIVQTFMPHGLGHLLGIQVHDVGGNQLNALGAPIPPTSKTMKNLRTTRPLRAGEVVTIEPGLYFIPILLETVRENSALKGYLNWPLIDELTQYGGIRIEDNLHIHQNGAENLTRAYLKNAFII